MRPHNPLAGISLLPTLLFTLTATLTSALNSSTCVSTASSASDTGVLLASSNIQTILVTDPASPPAIHHLARSFCKDIQAVTQSSSVTIQNTSSLSDLEWSNAQGQAWVFIGGLDGSGIVNEVVNATGLEGEMSGMRGQWEAYSVVTPTLSGSNGQTKDVVLIAGSDKRGAIYGTYAISEQMGVSPWYWWADVPISTHSSISVLPCSHPSASIKYRGIFLNDEQPGLTNWANRHYNAGNGPKSTAPLGQSFLEEMYGGVFELILRLKGNYMWPAMWADMFAVAGLDGLPGNGTDGVGAAGPNQVLAGEMGIVYGTSHQEPMARNTPEWSNFGEGDWNYTTNKPFLDQFWTYGAERGSSQETIFTVGMRGNGDLPLPGANIPILEGIVADQRQILSKAFGGRNASTIPQVWCLYKEVQGYFSDGLQVPDDVTLLWTDDNWGNIRRVPASNETSRAGRAGLYYHFDYVGDPRNYKWISTINFAKTWEQLNVAQSMQMDELWIFNVGDLKPIEVPIAFALDMGYSGTGSIIANGSDVVDVTPWLEAWAGMTFPSLPADQVARVIGGYNALNAKIKPELVNSTSWSLTTFHEAERVQGDWKELTDLVYEMWNSVDEATYPAFYQLIAFPTLASANLNELYITVGKGNLYAQQFKTAANIYADKAKALFNQDANYTDTYHALLDGKWDGMMSQPHINQFYWQQNMRNVMPGVMTLAYDSWPKTGDGMSPGALLEAGRITIQGSSGAWPGDSTGQCAQGYNCPPPTLQTITRYTEQSRYFQVGSGSCTDFDYWTTTNVTWLDLTPGSGHIAADGSSDATVYASVDWDKVDAAQNGSVLYAAIQVYNTPSEYSNASTTILVSVDPTTVADAASHQGGFVQGDGYIAMHSTNATRRNNVDGAYWASLPGYGLTGNAITDLPPTHDTFAAGQGPSLEFDFYYFGNNSPTSWNVTAFFGPFENYHNGNPFQYALQIDGGEPTVVQPIPLSASAGSEPPDWNGVVAASLRKGVGAVNVTSAGGWHTLAVWNMVPGMVLEMVTLGSYPITSLPPPQSYRIQ